VGDSAVYSGSIWQRSGGATGTVTSVGLSTNGGAITIGNSPISTSGVISANFNGTNLQYVNGAGNLTTFPTLITSIGLSMPSAFSVANSPLTANGTIAVTGAGTTAQYIRGDGSLATFPTIATEAQRLITEVYNETGATLTKGTVVYINGGHGNLPTVTKAIATGDATSAQTYGIVQTDITNMNNGYVVVIGSLMDLDTQAYANGTQLYLSSTTAGAWTSVKQYAPAHLVYVGIVVRSHPTQGVVEVRIQNGFELDELHNVSAQSPLNNQGLFYNTSTSLWENKSIATALGYTPADDSLVVHLTGNETIGGTKTFSDATKNNGGIFLQNASSSSLAGYMNLGGLTNGVKFTSGGGISNSFTLPSATGYTFTFPNATGTIALTSDIPSITGLVPYTGATGAVNLGFNSLTTNAISLDGNSASGLLNIKSNSTLSGGIAGYVSLISGNSNQLSIWFGGGNIATFTGVTLSSSRTYTLPDASGTIALVGGSGVGTVTSVAALTIGTSGTDLSSTVATSTTTPVITLNVPTASATNRGALSSADWTTFNNKQGTITLTTTGTSGAATFSSNTLNIPQYQGVLTNPVTGTGTTNYLPKFTGASTIGNSQIFDNGTQLAINTASPSGFGTQRFLVVSSAASQVARFTDGTNGDLVFDFPSSTVSRITAQYGTGGSLVFANGTGFTPRMTLNNSGNLGLGVTPSAWWSGMKAVEAQGSSGGVFASASVNGHFLTNGYYDGTNWVYKNTGFVSYYSQTVGQHQWLTAPSGTAGNAISFTQAMTLDASGRLGIGTTSPTHRLQIQGASNSGLLITNSSGATRILLSPSGAQHGEFALYNSSDNVTTYLGGNGGNNYLQAQGGNVGIGTTSPSWLLQLEKNSTSGGAGQYPALVVNNPNAAGYSAMYFFNGGTNVGGLEYSNSTTNLLLNSYGALLFQTASGNERMRITSGGRVGIGQTSPGTALSVAGQSESWQLALTSVTGTSGAVIGSPSANVLAFGDWSGSERMRITSGGNVEINTGSIKTGTPSGGTAKPWKLGQDTSTLYSATRTIQVEIDGGTYYLLAVKSTDL